MSRKKKDLNTGIWNYRLVATKNTYDIWNISIREVYYKKGKIWLVAEGPAKVWWDELSLDIKDKKDQKSIRGAAKRTLKRLKEALKAPILYEVKPRKFKEIS